MESVSSRRKALLGVLTGQKPVQVQQGVNSPSNNDIPSGSMDDWAISPAQTVQDVTGRHSSSDTSSVAAPTSAPTLNQLELPPLSEVLPVVDNYFRNYNTIIPLFDETAFMRMLLELFAQTTKRSIVPWAAINVVLAISYRVLEGRGSDDSELARCLQNVRSVMAELMVQGKDLIGLQVLLGMVILFLGSSDFQLAIVLTGSVVRLAQSLRLNSKESLEGFTSAEKAHRTSLFWLTYIYDREMSQRSQSRYHQLDSDTDMDLPDSNPETNLGMIISSIDSIRFNYIRVKARLAYIHGKVYNLLYSPVSRTLTQEEKNNTIIRIEKILAEWVQEMPTELHTAEGIRLRLSPAASDLMMNLWFHHAELHTCGSFSCLVLLVVNLIEHPDQALITDDRQLLDNCFLVFEEMSKYLPKEPYSNMLAMAHELDEKAMDLAKRKSLAGGSYEAGDFLTSPSTAWAILDEMDFQ
ncbi:hypothetical protein NW768_010812 [Fusarium equiseti]|uniref:Xylanolytic transcriptional activator regulatory domain-containing protein n=1 Tax=Fusarium equiseti TaxID=61235 RepID=A0ABQ8QZ45_FUSEQ|nr:hypothetical protein NW768_010812 [Fusarium equiseti]